MDQIARAPIVLMAEPIPAMSLTAMSNGPMTIIMTSDPINVPREHQDQHERFEFFLPLSSIQKLNIDDQVLDCYPGQIIPINPGQSHGFRRGNKAASFILIQFEPRYFTDLISDMTDGKIRPFENEALPLNPDIQTLSARIIHEFDEKRPGRDRLLRALTDELAILLIRTYYGLDSHDDLPVQVLHDERYLRFRQVIEYMQSHLSDKVTIDELASIASMNRFHFIRTFKAAFSKSPYDYLTDLRIEQAKRLLQKGRVPAADIGRQCGFFSASRFSAAFRQATGVTPSRYRHSIKMKDTERTLSRL